MKRLFPKTFQNQLILYVSAAIILPTIITSIIGYTLIQNQILNRAETKCVSDLNSAQEIYRNKISQIESVARITASRSFIISSLINKNRDTLQKELEKTMLSEKLDFLTIVDEKGIVVSRGRNKSQNGDTLLNDIMVRHALENNMRISGTDIMSYEMINKESEELALNCVMSVEPTNGSAKNDLITRTNGMVLKAAVPVIDVKKGTAGVLIAGIVINRNYEIVDKIKDVVHEGEYYEGKDIGTATIFQGDMRISTNVKKDDGSIAVSTIVSDEVSDVVLNKGNRYIGEAIVVKELYLTAYEPIKNINGDIIGMLYVGLLKEPFYDILNSTILLFFGVNLGVLIIVYILALYISGKISKPLKQLENIANRIASGDYQAEFKISGPKEVENLANSLNKMSIELDIEKKEVENWAKTLEEKVNERTKELKKINAQLFRSEKLASIGKLAAGVAHEINNPLTGVLTNSSLLLEDLPENDTKRDDVQVIVNETIRCREIVKRLLDFARQTQPLKKVTDVNLLLENIILLVRNQASFRKITILKFFDEELPLIMADNDQIQQVFINLILNASDAMSEGGTLSITTKHNTGKDYVEVKFRDTGCGISEENRDRIFDPFYTTKENGTGLGLSITYGIIEQHGGTMDLESAIGKGTTFIIRLPINSPD